jgi:hypothetical protein
MPSLFRLQLQLAVYTRPQRAQSYSVPYRRAFARDESFRMVISGRLPRGILLVVKLDLCLRVRNARTGDDFTGRRRHDTNVNIGLTQRSYVITGESWQAMFSLESCRALRSLDGGHPGCRIPRSHSNRRSCVAYVSRYTLAPGYTRGIVFQNYTPGRVYRDSADIPHIPHFTNVPVYIPLYPIPV